MSRRAHFDAGHGIPEHSVNIVYKGVVPTRGLEDMPTATSHELSALHNKTEIGFIQLGHSGEINHVEVEPEWQRKGIATRLWLEAEKQGLNPEHSSIRSQEGDAWAQGIYKKGIGHEPPPNEADDE